MKPNQSKTKVKTRMMMYTKNPPASWVSREIENMEEEKYGAKLRIPEPAICVIPLVEPSAALLVAL